MVEVAVSDTGSGIRPEVLERMFEPFFSTKEVGKGSGMGLATVHGIVHEYGGHIVVDTAAGAGHQLSRPASRRSRSRRVRRADRRAREPAHARSRRA